MPVRVLMELRPCFDDYSGIPVETRILFENLARSGQFELGGHLLDLNNRVNGFRFRELPSKLDRVTLGAQYIVALEEEREYNGLPGRLNRLVEPIRYLNWYLRNQFSHGSLVWQLEEHVFDDYLWRRLFAPSLSANSKDEVLGQRFYGSNISWGFANRVVASGVPQLKFDTRDWDIYIAQTPFSGRLSANTRLVVRYHDAIPLTHPHTIEDKFFHNRIHASALAKCAPNAHFVCNSEATRETLLDVHPGLEDRSVVIPCSVSSEFYPERLSCVQPIVSKHTHLKALTLLGCESLAEREKYAETLEREFSEDYLFAVGSLDPRKNFSSLVSAWSTVLEKRPELRLVLVTGLGWDYRAFLERHRHDILRGKLILLTDVAVDDLRRLYSNAIATVCPSFAEGFDYPGVESMRCGTPVIASEIPTHLNVYRDAAIYFDPYQVKDLTEKLMSVDAVCAEIDMARLRSVGEMYDESTVSAQWVNYLDSVAAQ